MNSRLYQILLQTPERAPNGIHNEFDIPTKLVQLWKETTNCSRSWRTSPSHQFFNLKLKKILLVTELSHINVERRNLEILTNFIYLRTSFYKKMLTLNSKVEPLSEGRRFEPISIFNWEIKGRLSKSWRNKCKRKSMKIIRKIFVWYKSRNNMSKLISFNNIISSLINALTFSSSRI